MSAKVKQRMLLLVLFCCYVLLAMFPEKASASVKDGIDFCLRVLLPAMFPYFVLSNFAVRSGCMDLLAARSSAFMEKVFGTSPASAIPFLLGAVSGYPVGAGCICSLYQNGKISRREADKLLTFCCGAGPAFVIGVVGNALYKNTAVGLTLYGIQILSAGLTGMLPIYEGSAANGSTAPCHCETTEKAFVGAVAGSAKTAAAICSYVILFFVLLEGQRTMLRDPLLYAITAGFTELSAGCSALAAADLLWPVKFSLTSACVSFGGLCVFLQTISILSDASLSAKPYIAGKMIQSAFSFLLAYPLSYLFGNALATGNFEIRMEPVSPMPWVFLPLAIIFLLFLQIPSSIWRKSAL